MNFTKEDISYLINASDLVEEVYVDDRKGVSQSKYVFEVGEENAKTFEVPSHLLGTWMMRFEGDLRYTSLDEAIADEEWVRCKEKKIVTTVWVEVAEDNK